MVRKLVTFLVLLQATLAFAQQSTPVKSESQICFSAAEFADFEVEIQAELERTAMAAAEAAVKPHVEYETKLQAEVKAITLARDWWRIGTFSALVLGIFGVTVVAVLR
jgi:hypothetical protein